MTESRSHQPGNMTEVWDAVSRDYDSEKYWRLPENMANLETLLAHIGPPEGKRILEMGSGSGYTSCALAQRGARPTLLDISPEALAVASAAFAREGLSAPELINAVALRSPLPSDTFDVAWNGGVIEHFYDSGKELLISEMLRVVRPGGVVIILVPNRLCWYFQIIQAWQKLRGTWKYGFEDDMSPGRLKRMCRRLGYEPSAAYAFNPVVGWKWVPVFGKRFIRLSGGEPPERHRRKAATGFLTVVVITKPEKR